VSKRERMKQVCDCGCKREVYHNQLVEVTVDRSIDETLRQAQTTKRFWVTRACKVPFEEELRLMMLLQILVEAYPPPAQTRWWLINAWLNPLYPWPRVLAVWWKRVGAARKVVRFQHAIHERNRGFEYAHTRAMQSGVLFACPRFMQGFMARKFLAKAKRQQAQEDATRPPNFSVVKA
jgi:hypothetical protein